MKKAIKKRYGRKPSSHEDVFYKDVFIWRPNKTTLVSYMNSRIEGKTVVTVTKSVFNKPLRQINSAALLKGRL